MRKDVSIQRLDKLFSIKTLALSVIGLIINLALANFVILLGLPLYIDNVGSVLVAALAGPIPGMAVGFLSNLINSATDPISMYYGILTIFNALAAAYYSKKGYLRSIWGCIALAIIMTFIGGACGSVMTWMLYGGGIGGIAAPLANTFLAQGLPPFWAQLAADVCLDIPDKLLTMLPVYLFLHFYPSKLYNAFPNSYLYDRSREKSDWIRLENQSKGNRTSVHSKISFLIVASSLIVSCLAIFVSIRYYQIELKEEYAQHVKGVSALVASEIDGNQVENYLAQGEAAPGYQETKERLKKIQENIAEVEYVYVYQIDSQYCHVVFDLDTENVPADPVGSVIPYDTDMEKYREELGRGEPIDNVVTNDQYGWLITSYTSIKNSAGETVAYGGADVPMENYIHNMLVFVIKMLSMLFGLALFVSSFALWYGTMRFTTPINGIVELTRKFNEVPAQDWLSSEAWKNRKRVHTGDEIEELYHTVCNVQKNISENVSKMIEADEKLRETFEIEKKNKELSLKIRRADEENAMKSEFYSRMSHDMRTLMNGIIGLVNLSKDEKNQEVLRENIEKIGMSGNYLLALINDTLDMNKIESNKMKLESQKVCFHNLLKDVEDMIRPTLEKNKIRFIPSYDLGDEKNSYLIMDEVRVKQVLVNLLSNAAKFTSENGTISLTITETDKGYRQKQYHIVLRDTGCGMSEDFVKNRIFKPFEQESNNITISSAGSGLGLSIVKNIVELMDGSIQVQSQLGEGTTFTVDLTFPCVDVPDQPEHKTMEGYETLKDKKILLCEDHPLNAEIMIRLLQKVGVETVHAKDGQQGVQFFEASKTGEYAAILMDVRMPVMNGLEATRAIRLMNREDARKVPIIALTANAYAEDRKMTKDAGMNAHLSKPIEPEQLYRTLVNLLES